MSSRHLILFGSKYKKKTYFWCWYLLSICVIVTVDHDNVWVIVVLQHNSLTSIFMNVQIPITKTPVLVKMLNWSYGWDQCQCWRGDGVTSTGSLVSTPVSPSLLLSPGRLHQTRQHGRDVWPWFDTSGTIWLTEIRMSIKKSRSLQARVSIIIDLSNTTFILLS